MFFLHRKNVHKTGCLVFHLVVLVLLGLAALASLIGVLFAHYDPVHDTLIFGTSAASLAILSFGVTTTLLFYHCRSCMGMCGICSTPKKK